MLDELLRVVLVVLSGFINLSNLDEFNISKSKLETPKEFSKIRLKIEGNLDLRG